MAGQMPCPARSFLVHVSPHHCRSRWTYICSAAAARGGLLCLIDEAEGNYHESYVARLHYQHLWHYTGRLATAIACEILFLVSCVSYIYSYIVTLYFTVFIAIASLQVLCDLTSYTTHYRSFRRWYNIAWKWSQLSLGIFRNIQTVA